MKVLYVIRNEKNVKDVLDAIVIEGDSWSQCEEKYIIFVENPDNDLPDNIYVEKFVVPDIEEI